MNDTTGLTIQRRNTLRTRFDLILDTPGPQRDARLAHTDHILRQLDANIAAAKRGRQ